MLLQLLAAGVTMGLVYAVIALGFQLVARGTGIFNFAHGEFVAIGTLAYFSLTAKGGIPPGLAVPIVVVVVAIVSIAMERLVLTPVKVREPLLLAILTVGVATMLRGVMLLTWGGDVHFAPPLLAGAAWVVFGASIPRANVVLALTSGVVLLVLFATFSRSLWGKKIIAAAIDPEAAKLVGIEPAATRISVFLLAGMMAGLAGALVAPVTFASAESGFTFMLKAFAAAMVGGLASFSGAVVGGIALGVLEALVAGYVSSAFRDPLILGLVILLLVVRPSGLFAGPRERVT